MMDPITVTVTLADVEQTRRGKAYCPLAAALARTRPDLFSSWNVGCAVAPTLAPPSPAHMAKPREEREDGWYRIPLELQEEIILPWDRGQFDESVLPFTGTLVWEES